MFKVLDKVEEHADGGTVVLRSGEFAVHSMVRRGRGGAAARPCAEIRAQELRL